MFPTYRVIVCQNFSLLIRENEDEKAEAKSLINWSFAIDIGMNKDISSVQFGHSVISDCLWPHRLQHGRLPCPSPSPGVHSNSRPSSRWCHPAVSTSVVPFSSCSQSLPASGSFPMSRLFASGGQSIGASASASVLPMNIQGWLPLGWTGLIKSFRTDQWFDQTISVENWYKVKHYHNWLNRIVTGCVTEITHFNNPGSVGYYPEMQPLQDNGSCHYHFMSITKKCLPLHSIRTSMNI